MATKRKKRPTLKGKKLSQLLAIAMRDLLAVEKMKNRFKVDMGTWHEKKTTTEFKYDKRIYVERVDSKCSVCMAGAVIACTLKIADAVELNPCNTKRVDDETRNALMAINSLREGKIGEAASYLDTNPTALHETITVASYDEDRRQFFRDMKRLHGLLVADGL